MPQSTSFLRRNSLNAPSRDDWLNRMSQDVEEMLHSQAKLTAQSNRLDIAAERKRMMKWNEEQEKKREVCCNGFLFDS